ncbi:hypothetical protein [Lentzea albida]|uniref:Uncharacterized protein n=1 Tax=Lentzea albida TaxID=65499 RepID=A0A1H9UBM8_9PSEU|nr:hypothetical protein [Lentzea albida]SES06577.1 hypothetical protein SAMN04488000_115147 [Lentzea albida]
MDRAYRLTDSRNAVRVNADDQQAVTALIGAGVLVPGRGDWLAVDGWPPRDYVLTLFISSATGRGFHAELLGGEQ